jgi:CheY-like chemotaxis protein
MKRVVTPLQRHYALELLKGRLQKNRHGPRVFVTIDARGFCVNHLLTTRAQDQVMDQPGILLVDDDQDVLHVTTEILRQAGYRTQSAMSADVALVLLREGLPFRLLITDVVLPDMLDGYALARMARDLCPGIRIIYLTGYPPVAEVRARGAPYGETLVKPVRAEDLCKAVDSLLKIPA